MVVNPYNFKNVKKRLINSRSLKIQMSLFLVMKLFKDLLTLPLIFNYCVTLFAKNILERELMFHRSEEALKPEKLNPTEDAD
jgi:hypothetical protein